MRSSSCSAFGRQAKGISLLGVNYMKAALQNEKADGYGQYMLSLAWHMKKTRLAIPSGPAQRFGGITTPRRKWMLNSD